MIHQEKFCHIPVSSSTKESSARVMASLLRHTFCQHFLTNAAIPFFEKQPIYLSAFERSMRSRNHRYVLECRGEEE